MKFGEVFKSKCDPVLFETEIKGIKTNSSDVEKGDVFICLKGINNDGHLYAEKAVKNGASIVVCEKDINLPNQVLVDNCHVAFAKMSSEYFGNPAEKLKIIGVTGTNGKTSTCYNIRNILKKNGKNTALIGTIQCEIGDCVLNTENTTPDAFTLNRFFKSAVEEKTEYVVMEVSSHSIDQYRIYGIEFEVGVFTNLNPEHLDYHKTMGNYFETKYKLFKQCKSAVINIDDEYGKRILITGVNNPFTVSVKYNNADFCAKNIKTDIQQTRYDLLYNDKIERVNLNQVGMFSVYNSMSAIACACKIGIGLNDAVEALKNNNPVVGRGQFLDFNCKYKVIVDYAHTPFALENILKHLSFVKQNRIITVFGCGGDRDKQKRGKMGEIASAYSDVTVITSDNPRSENPMNIINDIMTGIDQKKEFKIEENRKKAIEYALLIADENDIILIAGKGHEKFQTIGEEDISFDEKQIISDYIKKDMN